MTTKIGTYEIKPGADLHGADLHGADLHGAYLLGADLHGADLHGADLHGADLRGADLHGAYLHGADLRGAYLHGADLHGAYLHGAYLRGVKVPDLIRAQLAITPDEGEIIGWKKCQDNVIVKLRIGANVRRSNATSRKCRAEQAEVLEVIGAEVGRSLHNPFFVYRTGETVKPDNGWEEDGFIECAPGIHFFITRAEAEAYS